MQVENNVEKNGESSQFVLSFRAIGNIYKVDAILFFQLIKKLD